MEQPVSSESKKPKTKQILFAAIATTAAVSIGATVFLTDTLSATSEDETATVPTETLANGVQAPLTAENSDHGYLLEDNRIPRLDSCEAWNQFWVFEGPAVSFAVASNYNEPNLAVSTQIYAKNHHLDADLDGVICFHENQSKPMAENTQAGAEPSETAQPVETEDWMKAAMAVREVLNIEQADSHPLDFAASPSVVPEHSKIVKEGVETALQLWAPFIKSDTPLAMTVVHPKDKQWFLKRWKELGKDNTGEFWWNLAKGGGGGAVGWTAEGIPNMYFMTSEQYAPPRGPVDYYVHEVTHFFQTLNLGSSGEAQAPCWYPEGTANFIGFSMTYPKDSQRTIDQFAYTRKERARILMDFYDANGGLTEKRLERDILKFPPGDETCQHETPQFGYNLGMFTAEKFIIDFGFMPLIEMTNEMGTMPLPKAFEKVNLTNYEKWVREDLFPYLLKTLPAEAR